MDSTDENFLLPVLMLGSIFIMGMLIRRSEKSPKHRQASPFNFLQSVRPNASEDERERNAHAMERANRLHATLLIWIGYASGVAAVVFLIRWLA